MSELKDLVGEHEFTLVPKLDVRHPISVDANGAMFGLDDTIYLIFEDENDGYRSSAGPLLSFKGSAYQLGGSYHEYLKERVLCEHETQGEYGENDVLRVISIATGRVIFRVGTTNVDDYYPSFVAEWQPENLSANRAIA